LYKAATVITGQNGIVDQKHQRFARFLVFEADLPQLLERILGIKPVQGDVLVANNSCATVGLALSTPCVHPYHV
jgi:hypothetical protein